MVTSDEIKFNRSIIRETPMPTGKGVIIATAEGQKCMRAAQSIQEKLESMGCKAQIMDNPEHEILLHSKMPVIAMGNLADSLCVKYMYYKFLCITDKSYPGKEGYNIRSIIDPFATGYNIIHIGYSDEIGLQKGVQAFIDQIQNPLPYFNEVYYTELAYDETYINNIKQVTLPEKTDLIPSSGATSWWQIGMACYITGDMKTFDTYLEGWRKMVELSKKNDFLIINTHLYMAQYAEPWRLLEFTGMFPDDLRNDIEECLFRWAQSSQGIGYASGHKSKNLPSHNHTMFCALSLCYLADYFGKRYPELEEPKTWKAVADDVFYTFNNGGWKPYCDDSSYSNQVTLPLVLMYSIFDDDHAFLKTGARNAAHWMKSIIGQNLFVPSFGDGSVSSPFPTALSMVLSHYLEDGELRRMLEESKGNKFRLGIGRNRLFDSGVQPSDSPDSGMTRISIDNYIYDIWSKNPGEGKRMTGAPPYGPKAQCFDKVSIRTGWDEINDDFLLLDGLGSNGIHAYNDCMGILDYTSKGIVWLVEENDYRWPEPENCSILTIARDGYASDYPGYALMEEQRKLGEDCFYIRMRVDNYNGTRWIREVFMVKGLCVVFHDTVLVTEEGGYVIGAHFRTPAKARLDGNTVKSNRINPEGKEYELRLTCTGSSGVNVNIDEIPYGERLFSYGGMYDKKTQADSSRDTSENPMWKARYNTDDVVVSAVTSLSSVDLKKDDSISFTHLVHPASLEDEDIQMQIKGQKLVLTYEKETYTCPLTYVSQQIDQLTKKNDISQENSNLVKKKYKFGHKVKQLRVIDNDTFVCALEGGKLIVTQKDKLFWEVDFEGEIHTVEMIYPENFLVIGHGNCHLTAVDGNGKTLWHTQTTRIPTLFASWELPYPKIVSIRYAKENDETIIIAGCGDNQIRTYNPKGELLNAFYIYATVPDAVEIADIDGDGKKEVIAAGKTESSSGTFYVHDFNGDPKRNIAVSGWLCNIRSHELRENDDEFILTTGMNYSVNFKIINIKAGLPQTIAEKRLGGTVNSVCINPDHSAVYAGTSKGSVLGFDMQGNHLWHVFVKDSVKDLFVTDDLITAVCENGKISSISKEGDLLNSGTLPDKPECCVKTQQELWIGCGNEIVVL